jgi:DnaK suppressor protein
MMKKSFLEKIKRSLIEQKTELQSKSYHKDDIDIDGDEVDEIQGGLIALVNNKLSTRDLEKLRKIENALQKIDNKSFGICEECEEQIAEKRLEINPYFSTCIACAERIEFEDKQRKRI